MPADVTPPAPTQPERGDATRKKLIEAGLKIYSEVGYGCASTRNLAAAAGANIAAIPYYFGSKEGLYLAVIDYIVDYYQKNLGAGLAHIRRALADKTLTHAQCRALLDDYMRQLVGFVLQESEERSQMSRIYIREQLDPTSAFNRLYDGFIRDMRETLEALVAALLGQGTDAPDVKLLAETLLGQVSIFKASRVTVLHHLGWDRYGEQGIADIERIIIFNVNALILAHQHKGGAS